MVFFTSDLHLGHESILQMQDRPFDTVEVMNEALINNINSCVHKNDRLYILGDISLHIPVDEANHLISRIHGRKYLLLGNHDTIGQKDECKYDPSLFEWIGDYLRISTYDVNIVMMHYPLLSWRKIASGSIMLHGHIHASGEYNRKNMTAGIRRFDVGVDANDYQPVSILKIKEMAEETIPVDGTKVLTC